MLPASLIVIPFFIMASTFHLIDSLWALMLANAAVGVPFATWMLKGFFDGIPRELEQAAMIDGCGHLTRVPVRDHSAGAAGARRVRDLSRDPVVVGFRVRASTLINDQARWTITTGLVSFIGEHGIDWPALMAAGVLSMVPMVVLFLLLEPFLVSGMTAGSQKSEREGHRSRRSPFDSAARASQRAAAGGRRSGRALSGQRRGGRLRILLFRDNLVGDLVVTPPAGSHSSRRDRPCLCTDIP